MKTINKKFILLLAIGLVFMVACTEKFDEINKQPGAITNAEASAKYFLTSAQVGLFAPNRFPYWRAQLLHADRYAGYFALGFNGCWWNDGLAYVYHPGYTDASYGWLEGHFRSIDNFLKITEPEGEFENEKMQAVALIMKSLYYQLFTDTYGEVPYTEAGDPTIVTPEFDTQKDIYEGIISDLNRAIELIGDSEKTGDAVEDLADNDLYYDGDLQKWRRLANSLKLRVALRARGAEGADFVNKAIEEALVAPLIEDQDQSGYLRKDEEISQWNSAAYGDVWHNFGLGSNWVLGSTLIDILRDNNDPRLSKYAKPAAGDTIEITLPSASDTKQLEKDTKALNFIIAHLDSSGVSHNFNIEDSVKGKVKFYMPKETHYVGKPSRLKGIANPYAEIELFSTPADDVIRAKNSGSITPELVFTAAEAYFLRAEAAALGYGGDANELYQNGIRQSMLQWGVTEADIETFLSDSPMGSLATVSSADDMIERISIQRWIALYTDAFEGWAVVRKSGYPAELAEGVGKKDIDLFEYADINGAYPQRMRYGNGARNNNGINLGKAIDRQGVDMQNTKLWWAKD